MSDIIFEDYVAPVQAPHEYQPIVQALIEAGPDKIASKLFDNEADAKTYILEMQKAARQLGMSGVKRIFAADVDAKGKNTGKIKAGVSVRTQITRTQKPNDQEETHDDAE